jgi:hypothetical protein
MHSAIDRLVGHGHRPGHVESQRMFAVGPEARLYAGAEGQSPNLLGPLCQLFALEKLEVGKFYTSWTGGRGSWV